VAVRVGKSRPTVANAIRLLELPEPIQKALMDGKISTGKAKAILSLKNTDDQMKVFSEMIGEKASVRDVEQIVAGRGAASRKGSVRRDPNLIAQEELIQDRLGSSVKITSRGEQGTITISYYSKEEFKRLMNELT
jgi:ParB family chromosome partitioning protein